MRAWQASLVLALGCGAPSSHASPTPSPAVVETPPPVATEAPALPVEAHASELAPVAEGAVMVWPDEPAASFTEVRLDLARGLQAVVAEDGKPLVAIGADRFVVVPTDGISPVRAYANDRGLSSTCGIWDGVGVAGGAFLTCSDDGALVARDIETLAVRWERPPPAPTRDTCGAGDTFLVSTDTSWVALDASSGATLWERADVAGRRPRLVQGLVFDLEDARLVALDARTGEERFHIDVDGASFRAEPVAGRGIALLPASTAPQPREVRLVALDGSIRSVRLDAALTEDAQVLVDADALTTIVEVGLRRLEVRRYDLRSGARTARSETVDDTGLSDLQALGRTVLFVNDLGARLLDAGQLAERWLGEEVGTCRRVIAWRPTTSRAPVLVCSAGGELSVFVARATPTARHRMTVSGTTRCAGAPDHSTVHVEGRITETDDDGRYRIEVMADDDLDVWASALDAPMDTACGSSSTSPVSPDARTMRVDVEMTWSSFDISGL